MLKRYEAIGRPAADQAILAWAFHDAIYKIQVALRLVVDNFPSRPMRAVLKFVVFPFGRRERAPGDRLTHRVAQLLLAPSDTRRRLTNGIYVSARAGHPIGVMEEASAEPLERKFLKAIKSGSVSGITWEQQLEDAVAKDVLTEEEAGILSRVRDLVQDIVAVDEFDSAELRLGLAPRLEKKRDAEVGKQHAA